MSAWPGALASNAASVAPRTAVAAGLTIGARIDSSLDLGCVQLDIPLAALSTTSSFWPTRIDAALVVSVTVTSKFRLEPVLWEGLGPAPVLTLPQPAIRTATPNARSRDLLSRT